MTDRRLRGERGDALLELALTLFVLALALVLLILAWKMLRG